MEYISTRNEKRIFNFKDVFLTGLAPDGGLFVPSTFPIYSYEELKKLKEFSYQELAVEIIYKFCKSEFSKDEIKKLVSNSYKSFRTENVVLTRKLKELNLVELFHGPTLAFKDIAMQIIGNMYDSILKKNNLKINIIVATSGDTGAAAINAIKDRNNMKIFVLHPHNKISNMQRKIMTTIGSNNIYNLAVKGTFDDCQKLVKEMFSENNFREKINMSGVNSINWARIVCQIVYYFYSAFKFKNKKIIFSVPTGNFGDIYAGYVAKKMGLPIEKLIVATNENDILERVINFGEYKPSKVKPSLSPSMDVQISSNFERLLFDVLNHDDKKVSNLMSKLLSEGSFKLNKEQIKTIKKDFFANKVTDKETLKIIKTFFEKYNFLIDPHTATAVGAAKNVKGDFEILILGTAHPYKFLETIKMATNEEVKMPKQMRGILDKKEKYDILENNTSDVKNYILGKLS